MFCSEGDTGGDYVVGERGGAYRQMFGGRGGGFHSEAGEVIRCEAAQGIYGGGRKDCDSEEWDQQEEATRAVRSRLIVTVYFIIRFRSISIAVRFASIHPIFVRTIFSDVYSSIRRL